MPQIGLQLFLDHDDIVAMLESRGVSTQALETLTIQDVQHDASGAEDWWVTVHFEPIPWADQKQAGGVDCPPIGHFVIGQLEVIFGIARDRLHMIKASAGWEASPGAIAAVIYLHDGGGDDAIPDLPQDGYWLAGWYGTTEVASEVMHFRHTLEGEQRYSNETVATNDVPAVLRPPTGWTGYLLWFGPKLEPEWQDGP